MKKEYLVESLIKGTHGKFFTVRFRKKDGSTRTLTGRVGVLKGTKTGVDRKVQGGVVVYEPSASQWRTVMYGSVDYFKSGSTEVYL